ncbi:lipocalin-like domain-containing protein [Chryseobacterium potabilaquae]|uniref:Lipocalin-like domain-containing protein n=1 Tax=Chryseobacterium potabilaquae TaxID=2675057 RepID=A0A6N4X911_9FLAO|nr:lipocalin family protein [Chryseobacterium potabilaquae]CAA7194818.1 hypothetical protein CHRY9293_01101 [Chryseobacterium potabilaquae]
MKKLAVLLAGLSLWVATGCNNDDNTIVEYSLVGTWMPVKEVLTTVETGEDPVTDVITYNSCQQESRWVFNEGSGGKRTDKVASGTVGQCDTSFERNFTYTYDKGEKKVNIKYQGIVEPDKGKVVTLNDTTFNLMIEDTTDPTEYHSKTYTFKRVTQ